MSGSVIPKTVVFERHKAACDRRDPARIREIDRSSDSLAITDPLSQHFSSVPGISALGTASDSLKGSYRFLTGRQP